MPSDVTLCSTSCLVVTFSCIRILLLHSYYINISCIIITVHPVSVRRFPSFRTQRLENLSRYLWTNGFLSNPAPGENLLSGNLVMETGCREARPLCQSSRGSHHPHVHSFAGIAVPRVSGHRKKGVLAKGGGKSKPFLRKNLGCLIICRRASGKRSIWETPSTGIPVSILLILDERPLPVLTPNCPWDVQSSQGLGPSLQIGFWKLGQKYTKLWPRLD